MKIGALARRAGLQPSAIRYYESAGLLPRADRRGGHRVYGPEALERLELLKAGQALGFSLAEVSIFLRSLGAPGVSAQWRKLAQRKIGELEQTIAAAHAIKRLLQEGLACGCVGARACPVLARVKSGRALPAPRAGARPGGVLATGRRRGI